MNKIIKGNTDFIIILVTLASIGLAFTKIMDVKDFFSLVLAVFSYKFGKLQPVDNKLASNEQLG